MVQSLLRWCSLWEDVEAFLVGKAQPEVLKLFRSNCHYCCFIMYGSSWIAVGCSLSVCDWPLTTFLYFSNVELSVCGGTFGQVWHIYYDVLLSLEEDGFLIISDTLHLFCAQHSFLPSLKVDLFSVVCHDTHPGVLESPLKAEDVESLHLDIDPLVPSSSFGRDISWTAHLRALYLHHHLWELGSSQGEVIRTSYFTKSSLRFLNHWWHWDSFLQ